MLDILDNPTIKKMLVKQLKKYFKESTVDCIVIKMNNDELDIQVYSDAQKIMPLADFNKFIQSLEL